MRRKPCRLWTKSTTPGGYGRGRIDGRLVYAHRWAWEQANGRPVPPGMEVMHVVCDVPGCWEPSHLAIGTRKDNQRDMVRKGRSLKGARNPRASLTERDVLEIHAYYREGSTMRALSERYGTTQQNIWFIVRGINWSYLGVRSVGRRTWARTRAR